MEQFPQKTVDGSAYESELRSVQEYLAEVSHLAKKHLEQIGPDLFRFIELVNKEKPDRLVFLDKGARVFGSPIGQFIKDNYTSSPVINFWNDGSVKVPDLQNVDEIAVSKTLKQNNLKDFEKDKIFFVDEIYAEGKSARLIARMQEILPDADIRYIAFGHLPNASDPSEFSDSYGKKLSEMQKNNRLIIYNNSIPEGEMFSRHASWLYVEDDHQNHTQSKKSLVMKTTPFTEEDNMNIPNAYWSTDERERILFEEKEDLKQKIRLETVREVKNMIYDELEKQKEINKDHENSL